MKLRKEFGSEAVQDSFVKLVLGLLFCLPRTFAIRGRATEL